MLSSEIRKKYLKFFKSKEHTITPSASLIPENDSTTLFNTAGMQPLTPFLMGEKHPAGTAIANCQKCVRTGDIDDVGDAWHLTFFEMLGNWPFGAYDKKQVVKWSWEFLTSEEWLGIDPNKLYITVFEGDQKNNIPKDTDSIKYWQEYFQSVNIKAEEGEKIFALGREDNWWGPVGNCGPCGPDTEMFVDTGQEKCSAECKPGCSCGKYAEIWNDVFMEWFQRKRFILIDGIHCLLDQEYNVNKKLLSMLEEFPGQKIVVANEPREKLIKALKGTSIKEGYIYTLENKIEKNNPKYFKKLLEHYGLGKDDPLCDEILYFDHKQENINAANKFGIETTLLYTDIESTKKFIIENKNSYRELSTPQIDTGFGLERATAILNGADNVYDSDLFIPIVNEIKELANISEPNETELKSIRIIADHIRSAIFIMGDNLGIAPSNLDQGYVVRRLLRTAIRHGKLLNIPQDIDLTVEIAKVVINLMKEIYPELENNKDVVLNNLAQEENQFEKTLDKGLKEFNKLNKVKGEDAFKLYSTYGFPLEMTVDLAKERGEQVNIEEFNQEFDKHKDLSRTASAGKFKGGLADHSEIVTKYHTATHLLHEALRKVLGEYVQQRGSNLNAERLRFDFSHPEKITDEEIKKVEDLVNEQIQAGLKIACEEKSVDEAKNEGAIGLFGDKYGDKVKVFTIGPFSKEICGGPHVKNTSELGKFKIIKEQSASAGVRRIKAILE